MICRGPVPRLLPGVAYFVSFVLIGTMIVLNLFIGVIMNSMDEVRYEQALEDRLQRKEYGLGLLEDDIADVNVGAPVRLKVRAFPTDEFDGRVARLAVP